METARDPLLDDKGGPFTGQFFGTPWTTRPDDPDSYGFAEDPALFFVRRPGRPFPGGTATAFAGWWSLLSGRLALVLGNRRYSLLVIEGPETAFSGWAGASGSELVRPDRAVLLSDGGGRAGRRLPPRHGRRAGPASSGPGTSTATAGSTSSSMSRGTTT